MFFNIRQHYQVMVGHSKTLKMHFWMIQNAKKGDFGRFHDFGRLDRLGIACYDRSSYFTTLGNTARSWRIISMSPKCIFEWSKVSKKRFLAIITSLVCWIDLILHFVIVLNVFIIQQCYQVMKDPSNITEMHFWMIIRAKNEGFGHFDGNLSHWWLHFLDQYGRTTFLF